MDEACPKSHERFVEVDKCNEVIQELQNNLDPKDGEDEFQSRNNSEKLVEEFRKLIDPYQEQPELLQPYLSDLIVKLTVGLDDPNISAIRYHTIFKFLYQLIKVTGFKSIGPKFPHDTDKLTLLIELLDKEDVSDRYDWQTRFVLTVWLSIVILTPFDLAKFDSLETADNINDKKISKRVYSILIRSLNLHDSCQHVTSFCLAKFFSRPDIMKSQDKLMETFVHDLMNELSNIKIGPGAGSMDDVKLIGYLRTLAYMFKFLPRDEMKLCAKQILGTMTKLETDKINRELVNHLIIKLIQRAGLSLLPKRLSFWRYKRGSRILGQVNSKDKPTQIKSNLDDDYNAESKQLVSGEIYESKLITNTNDEETNELIDNEEEVNSAEYIESILSVLFVAAQNGQTKIRWSAAKGIARLSSRLSRELASDVIDMVLNNFFNLTTSSEFAWHGGCLILAEMSRNGLILEEKLGNVIKIVGQAIIYDKIKGSLAVGSHVREAACYVCWAMARTYEDNLLEPYVSAISVNLLCTMLFDRELQCRRAASAAFQELVGRQGTFNEEGINILTNVDYQNVGQRDFTYLHLSLQVASYGNSDKYAQPFVEHLLEKKVGHWDVQIRRQASDSLSALMLHSNLEFVKKNVLPQLMKMVEQNLDNNMKHGGILGLAKVVRGLVPLQFKFDQELIDFMGSIVELCEKQLATKSISANFIEAIGHVIASCEIAKMFHPPPRASLSESGCEGVIKQINNSNETIIKQWETIALSALDNDNNQLREIGAQAVLTLYRTYYENNKSGQDKLLTILNKSLNSLNESSRCGALRALSKLSQVPSSFLDGESKIRLDSDTHDIILMSITGYIAKETHEQKENLVFAQAKAEACEALVNFICSMDKSRIIPLLNLIKAAYEALLEKTEDYTLDKRGDIGVVVRRASIKALLELTVYLHSINLTQIMFTPERSSCLIERIITKFLQQSVSYNNSARELAATAFYKLISIEDLPENSIPHRDFILSLFDKYNVNDEFNWRDDSTPIFVNLLSKPEYSLDLWIGLLPSVGQVSDKCAKQFRDALSSYIISLLPKEGVNDGENLTKEDANLLSEERDLVFAAFFDCLTRTTKLADRLLTSGLIVTDYLLSQGLMNDTSVEFQMNLLEFCWQSRGKGDLSRLLSVACVLSSFIQFDEKKIQETSLKYCLELLINGYARVRVYTAEQFYISLMTYQIDGLEEENLNKVMDLLRATDWKEPLDKVKQVQKEISSYLFKSV